MLNHAAFNSYHLVYYSTSGVFRTLGKELTCTARRYQTVCKDAVPHRKWTVWYRQPTKHSFCKREGMTRKPCNKGKGNLSPKQEFLRSKSVKSTEKYNDVIWDLDIPWDDFPHVSQKQVGKPWPRFVHSAPAWAGQFPCNNICGTAGGRGNHCRGEEMPVWDGEKPWGAPAPAAEVRQDISPSVYASV